VDQLVNPTLTEILTTGTVVTPDGEARQLHSNIPQLEGELIQAWIAQQQPRRLLEIGFAYGISTLFICDALTNFDDLRYDIIDNSQQTEWEGIGIANLERAGYDHIYTLHEADSTLRLPQMVAEGRRFDFALVDSWHAFDHTLVEFFYINRMLEIGGVVVFDDFHTEGIQKLAAYMDGLEFYERLPLPDEFEKRREVRVRRMRNVPPTRLVAYRKTGADERGPYWFKEF
jgi:predicted O-methyltransferase YrrM